jgi:OPA family sugar phosphate sensor protein UhpC-like MFS transporter
MPEMEQSRVRNPLYERWRWQVFAATYLAYAGFYLTRKGLSVAKADMLDDPTLGMTKDALGAIDAAYLIAYAIGQFIWGIMGDRYGPRKVVLIGILVSVITGFAMGASSTVLLFGVFFFVQGLAQSSGWGPLTKNVGYWFCLKERGRAYGWWGTNYAIGGLIATPFAAYAVHRFSDWRFAFYVPAAAFLVIGLLFVIFQRNRPEDAGLQSIEEYSCEPTPVPETGVGSESKRESSWASIVGTLRKPMVLRLAFTYFLLKPTRYAILFWGPLIVKEKLGTGVVQSGLISVMFELGGPLGVVAAGYASDKLFRARRIPVCVIFLLLLSAVTFSFGALTSGGSSWMMAATLFAIGFFLFGPDSVVVGTAAVDFGSKKGASSAAGFINGVGSVGAVLGGSLPGIVSQRWGWEPLFYALGGCVFVAALLLLPKWNAVPKEAGK